VFSDAAMRDLGSHSQFSSIQGLVFVFVARHSIASKQGDFVSSVALEVNMVFQEVTCIASN